MRRLAGFVLALWLIAGLFLTLAPAHPLPGQVVDDNLIPFHTLRIYLDNLGSWFWMRNLLGNLALLLPLGLLGPIAIPALSRWWRVALLALLISSAIELTQLAVPDRSADIDDVIVNVTGALLGFVSYRLGRRLLGPREQWNTQCRCESVHELWDDEARAYAAQHLELIETRAAGWETLYQCPITGRKWLLDYPNSEQHGGGRVRLLLVTQEPDR